MKVEFKNFVRFAIDEANLLRANGKKVNLELPLIGNQFQGEMKYFTEIVKDEQRFVFSSIDFVLNSKPDLRDKIANFINGDEEINVLEQLLIDKEQLLTLDLDVVKEASVKMIDINGSVTTLEIKQIVRNLGYRADQRNVSEFMNELYREGFLKFDTVINNGEPHRLYIPGDNYYIFDLNSVIDLEKDTEVEVKEIASGDTTLDSIIKDKSVLNTVIDSKEERNKEIIKKFATGEYKVIELAVIYGISDRTVRKIVYGK